MHKSFHLAPAEPIDGDAFGLHEPLTLGDVERIEKALADGSVTGAEADRLRAIRDRESAKLTEAFAGITTMLNDHFGDALSKVDLGPKLADLMPTVDLGPKLADLMPTVDLGPKLADLMPTVDYPRLPNDIATPRLGSIVTASDFETTFQVSAIEPNDAELFVDNRPAHMEELAERQLEALNAACDSLEATATAVVESDQRAADRFTESQYMNRSQTHIVVIVTIVAALVSGVVGAMLARLLQ